MDPERFDLVKQILVALEDMPVGDRAAYLDRACTGDPALRAEVESLMREAVPSIMRTGGLAARILPMIADDGVPGRMIGRYRLLGVLGEGGMGVVYRALQTEPMEREVALKLVPSGMNSARMIERFESERQALALMNHPYIAHALDAGTTDGGRPYFVMELVTGEPVTEYCARERPPLAARLALFLRICEAIQHAHQRGIIHRDLKPSNVLLISHGTELVPKVIDFGIARAFGEADGRLFHSTMDGHIVGTPEYMSPEQAGAIDAGLDTRTDVYSLGVMLYELVSGQRPYELKKRTPMELERALRTPPVPPSRVNTPDGLPAATRINRDIDAVALMAIERMPDDRYASVEQLADDVRRVLEHRPVRARTQTWSYRTTKFVRRNAATVAATAVMLALAIAGGVGILQQRNRALASEARAVSEAARARTEAEKASEVARFLVDLFRESDPARARGAAVTARELLERGAARLSTELTSQDVVRATLMDTIGVVYRALGMFDESEKITSGAIEVRQRLFGGEHPDIAAALDNLGQLARERTRYDAAERYHRQALAMRRKLLDARDTAIAESASNLALALRERGQYPEALVLVEEALAIRREKLGPDHNDTLASMNVRGDIMSSSGKLAEAAEMYEAVLAARRRLLPAEHPRLAISLNNVGGVRARAGRLDEAVALYRESLAIRRKVLDPDHPDVTTSLVNLASTLHDLGRLDEAEPLLREALAADRRHGGNTMDVAIDLNNLAALLEDRGKFQEAGRMYEESMTIRVALQGEKHASVATILHNIGRLRFVEGASTDAERAFRRAIDIRNGLGLQQHPRQGETILWLGRLFAARHRFDEAERHYTSALAIQRAAAPSGSPRTADAMLALGHVMIRKGNLAGAEPLVKEALAFRRGSLPAGHRAIGDAEAALAEILVGHSKWSEAAVLLDSALKTAPSGPSTLFYNRKDVLELRARAGMALR